MTGSRISMLGCVMSMRARSTFSPSPNRPARMSRSRARFSVGLRSRHGLATPGVVKSPRVAEIVSAS